jgi:hypothetical protein
MQNELPKASLFELIETAENEVRFALENRDSGLEFDMLERMEKNFRDEPDLLRIIKQVLNNWKIH